MKNAPILERVQEMTRQGREREAERLFDLKEVKKLISEAAGDGFSRVTVAPSKPVDVSQTVIAKTTIAALKTEGFSTEWEVRQHPNGHTSQALIIRWDR